MLYCDLIYNYTREEMNYYEDEGDYTTDGHETRWEIIFSFENNDYSRRRSITVLLCGEDGAVFE
jgi:hypothetical protein